MPLLLCGFLLGYGTIVTHGFVLDSFHWSYAIILIPIWIIDGLRSLVETVLPVQYKKAGEDVRLVSVIVPCKDGEHVLAATLDDLVLRFDPNQIIVVSNGSTDKTCSLARSYGARVIEIPHPVGKVAAINHALQEVATPYVLLLDDDTLIGGAIIPTELLETYDAVAFRVLVVRSTWITQLQSYEYRKSCDIGKRHHNRSASVQNISGAIGLFHLDELKRQIRIHNGEFSGEDLQRTLLLHLSDSPKGVVLANATVYTNPPTSITELYMQRTGGWFPGLVANLGNYVRIMIKPDAPAALKVDAFYSSVLVSGMDFFRLLSLPILFFYPWYFVVLYLTYVFFEFLAYVRTGAQEPLWVVLAYPLYGLFNFITRIVACFVLLYRRLVFHIGRLDSFDAYRRAPASIKAVSSAVTLILASGLLCIDILTYTPMADAVSTFVLAAVGTK